MPLDNFNPNRISVEKTKIDVGHLIEGMEKGDRTCLSKAITYVESTSPKHHTIKEKLLEWAYSKKNISGRIGITGAPGVGKSSFIEKLGKVITHRDETLAVLSIDPSSSISGGSILGDKTRMEELSMSSNAYIRPSPSSNVLGGVAGATRESIALCEATGFDWIIVETVGVGQSEYAVHKMTDLFILLLLPGAGDSLQGIKRGIVEMADFILVNKSDGDRESLSRATASSYRNALQLLGHKESKWITEVQRISSLESKGISETFSRIRQYFELTKENGYQKKNREIQALTWFQDAISTLIFEKMRSSMMMKKRIEETRQLIVQGKIAPGLAAHQILEELI